MESKGTLTKSKILAEIKKLNKVFANLGVDIVVESADDLFRDATRTALPKGRRVSKNGKEYYESRPNRSDSLQGTAVYPKLKLARGGEIRYDVKGNNFSDKIENGKKMKSLIQKAYESQEPEEDGDPKYPLNFIMETAFTGKVVKHEGKHYLKDYMMRGTASHFSFLDNKYFLEALTYTNRPAIKKFAEGGMADRKVRIIKDVNFDGYFKIVDVYSDMQVLEDNIRGVNNAILIAENEGYDIVSVDREYDEDDDDKHWYDYAKGGMVDLFEDYENIPEKVAVILDRYKDEFGEDMDYKDTQNMLNEIEAVGYTFDYYLDNVPYGLRPIGTPLSALQGYEDEEDVDYDDYEDYDDEDGDGSEREYLVVCQDRESGEQQEFEVYAEDEEEAREMALSDCDFKNPKIISVERYAKGGSIDDYSKNLASVEVKFANPKYNYETNVSADTNEAEVRRYFVGQMFDVGVYPKENMQRVVDIVFHPKGTYAKGGFIASSPSLDGIKKMISDYYFGSTISLVEVGNNTFEVHNAKGVRPSVEVVKKAGRYRFQQKENYAKGGQTNYLKKWEVTYITKYGSLGVKEITLGRMSDKDDVKNQLKRMDLNIREVISIKEVYAKGGRTYAMPEEKIIS